MIHAFLGKPDLAEYEFSILKKLHEAQIPVPQPLQVQKFKNDSFLAIEGSLLGKILQPNPFLIEDYVENLFRIHSLDWKPLFSKGKLTSIMKMTQKISKEEKRYGFNEMAD
ncbi:MAG: hypothetical protein D6732_19555 [Methanobacteriota archaeon]|nr:MAG: hypothetical protein D6732_19555 [Euryarchaeota archaeon]